MSTLSDLSHRLKAAVGLVGAAHHLFEQASDDVVNDARWTLEEGVKALRQIDEELETLGLSIPENPLQEAKDRSGDVSREASGDKEPELIDVADVRRLAEELLDTSEGIFQLTGSVGDEDREARLSGIRALARQLDDRVTKLCSAAHGIAS